MPLPALIISNVLIWGTLSVMILVYGEIYRVADWVWNYYHKAQDLLDEARQRMVELEQASKDLAAANLQLTRLNNLAHNLRQAAEAARTAKEEFVANVSHELRTPLNMIISFSEMILQSPETYGSRIPAALLTDLDIIYRNARHLSELIDDVLDLSQIEASQMALTKESTSFTEIVDSAVAAVRPLFESKGLYLHTELPDDLPRLFCDRTRLREVLLNLLSNAGRFTEHGGVRLRVWQERGNLLVAVTDTGRGISAEAQARLFQPFQQLDSSIRRRYGGTGLGLTISKRFIELHGGRIWVESQEGVGTTFTFELPLTSIQLPEVAGRYLRGVQPGWEFLERREPSKSLKQAPLPRLVVLETGQALQRLLNRYLDGVEIVAVKSLEDAYGALAVQPSQALLVNDLAVAEMLERVESTPLPAGTPVIICSVPGTQEAAGVMGVADYLVKPISREQMLSALDRLTLRGNTILIVDDEPEAQRLFRRMLDSPECDYRVLRAADGKEALEILRSDPPDAILLDLMMPNMDGFQLLRTMSQDARLHRIPVIVCSARDPAGQPIVSHALAVTLQGGISAGRLISCIRSISEILSTAGQFPGPAWPEESSG